MNTEEIIEKYIDTFGGFPSFLMMGKTDEEVAQILGECLRTGKPLEVEIEPDTDY